MTGAAIRNLPSAVCIAWLVAACDPSATVAEKPRVPQDGPWQASITVPGGEIETAFEISHNDQGYQASLVNGQERFRIDEVRFSEGELVLRFPVYNNEIRATLSGGELNGWLTLIKRHGETETLPFHAKPGSEHSHEAPVGPAPPDLSGRWSAQFKNEDGTVTPSVGEFAQRGSRLFGTFVNIDGDHRYLSGHVDGSSFRLSTFDGAHALLFSGTLDGDVINNADFWSGTSLHQTWSATRDPEARLPDAYSRTHLREGYDRLTFSFPDHEGRKVSLADEKFDGKVVVITLAGTWCPNCNDEARFLRILHERHRDEGLEIIALMFEHFEDMDIAVAQVEKFRAKYNIDYDTLIAGISDKDYATQQLQALDAVLAFPTTIFVDRSGRVRTIHTGFSGPGTGEYYERLKTEFTAIISEMLAAPDVEIETPATDSVVGE